jgi:hypothetical protein
MRTRCEGGRSQKAVRKKGRQARLGLSGTRLLLKWPAGPEEEEEEEEKKKCYLTIA